MSLTGATIYMHQFGSYAPLAKRLEMRKTCGPYLWTVPAPGPFKGCGYYASDDLGNMYSRDSTLLLRACERPARGPCYSADGHFTFSPVVLRLPNRRGFLAGYTLGKGMASSVAPGVYEDEGEAWQAAAEEARIACDSEAEYQAEQEDDDGKLYHE